MIVQLASGLAPPSQMVPWLAPRLPRYSVGTTAGYTAVSSGMWIQVMIRPHQQGAKLVDGMPIVPRLLMVVGFLGGIVPGLIFSLIYFAVCSSTWKRMHAEIAGVLRGELEAVGSPGALGPAGAQGVSSGPLLSEQQTNALKRYALPAVAGLLFLAAPGCALGAWESGKGARYSQRNLTCIEQTRSLTKQDLVWASAGQDPPLDCPEKALAQKQNDSWCAWETKVSGSQCHSSAVTFSEPSPYGYGSRDLRFVKRGSEYWSLATPESLQSRLASLRRAEGRESSRRNRDLVWAIFYLMAAAGCVAAGAACSWFWFRREKQREATIAQSAPA